MSVIQLLHGNQTFKNTSTKINVFVMRADKTDKRDFPNKHLEQVKGTYSAVPAALDGYKDHGTWYNTRYTPQDGRVLLIMANTTYHGSPYSNGAMLVCLREEAPLLKIDVNNNAFNANAVHQVVPTFSGNADILTLDEVEDYGIVFNHNFINNYFDEEEVDELFSISVLSRGTPRPKMLEVRTPEGSVRKVAIGAEGSRRIRIRRKK